MVVGGITHPLSPFCPSLPPLPVLFCRKAVPLNLYIGGLNAVSFPCDLDSGYSQVAICFLCILNKKIASAIF